MGVVYRAEHETLEMPTAVKVLHKHLSHKADVAKRFENEARAASRIGHPGIVKVMDVGRLDNRTFILMEFLQGESLADRLERVRRLGEERAVAYIRQAAGALGAAHKKGIIHRDLKPDNMFLVPDPDVAGGERIKLLDFGIAKLMEGEKGLSTHSGALLGTPPYMSPEQCSGAGQVDVRSDLYSLGVILFEMLCGRRPFTGRGFGEYIAAHLTKDPPSVSEFNREVSESVRRIVARLLVKNRDDRYATAGELIEALNVAGVPRPRTGDWSGIRTGKVGTPADSEETTQGINIGPTPELADTVPDDGAPVVKAGKQAADTPTTASNRARPVPRDGEEPTPGDIRNGRAMPSQSLGIVHTALQDVAPMHFVGLTGGTFTMGSPVREEGRSSNETEHEVTVLAFDIAEAVVTQKQWQAVMGSNPSFKFKNIGNSDEHPVQNISWYDAIEFLNKLSQREGLPECYEVDGSTVRLRESCTGYRLPTEAEWEYACRGGSQMMYGRGVDGSALSEYAWYDKDWFEGTVAVKSLKPDAWGLYDMHGNVWEWVWDRYAPYPKDAQIDPHAPTDDNATLMDADDTAERVLRGGAYFFWAVFMRCAGRYGFRPGVRFGYVGLRVVRCARRQP